MRNHIKTALILIAAAMSATSAGAQVTREYIHSWEPDIGYAQVVRHGNVLYLSGITSEGATLEDQMTGIYAEIGRILATHGLSSKDVIRETIYTQDIEAVKAAIPLRKTFYVDGVYPAATWVQVERLYDPAFKLEIEVEAATDGH